MYLVSVLYSAGIFSSSDEVPVFCTIGTAVVIPEFLTKFS